MKSWWNWLSAKLRRERRFESKWDSFEEKLPLLQRKNSIRVDPYRTTNNNNDIYHCSRCFITVNLETKEPLNILYWPYLYMAPREGPFCYECLQLWISENSKFCEPYKKLQIKLPVGTKEFSGNGVIMYSKPFEWFYPHLKPGQGPFK